MLMALAFAASGGWLANLSISVYAHRCLAHRALSLHPAVAHFFRFAIWLTTGTGVRRWVAVHRQHHACPDQPGDPHSPVVHGLPSILFGVYWFYKRAAMDEDIVRRFGQGCPDDWLERNLYADSRGTLGLVGLAGLDLLLFEPHIALVAMVVQLCSMPLCAGVINGLGHHAGYRNHDTRDHSHNLIPLAVFIGGEELHNNHHRYPSVARFSHRPWEVDIGWVVISALRSVGLAWDVRDLRAQRRAS
ncbi:MAG: fatty acid desaturase [Alphaproteobacteria bacterium]|nr:fatty acid desaturase [Alphaproteobacteria bacterium]